MISSPVKEIVAKLLHEYADNIKNGTSDITIEEASNILAAVAHIKMTKPEVCEYLNISRSRFDDLVREGKLPRGKKIKHDNNLVWYKDEIISAIDES